MAFSGIEKNNKKWCQGAVPQFSKAGLKACTTKRYNRVTNDKFFMNQNVAEM
jgi:hypothetical protein